MKEFDMWVTYLERYLIKVVRMDHTEHLRFRQTVGFDVSVSITFKVSRENHVSQMYVNMI